MARYAIIGPDGIVRRIMEGSLPVSVDGWRGVELVETQNAAAGWTWTEQDGFREPARLVEERAARAELAADRAAAVAKLTAAGALTDAEARALFGGAV